VLRSCRSPVVVECWSIDDDCARALCHVAPAVGGPRRRRRVGGTC